MSKLARMDSIHRGGDAAFSRKLLASGMDVRTLRTATTLRKDEWKELDQAVVETARDRMTGVNDLISRGLVYNIGNGLGTTVLETETVSDMNPAQMDMAGDAEMAGDQAKYGIGYLPLPITHKDFQIPIRRLSASRTMGQAIDVTQAQLASKLVSELVETTLFTGASTYTFGGGTIYGYMDHPNRNTVSLTQAWDASAGNGTIILGDVLSMKQASINAKHYGPWVLYIPTAYERVLDEDFKTNSDLSVRQRLLQIDGLEAIKVADKLTAANVIMVEMAPETVRMVVGMQPTIVEWETKGGMIFDFKVMTIMVPQIRADQSSQSGIVHLS